jgi:hypothetical protein
MFSKTTRYIAFILAIIIIVTWTFSFFYKKNQTKETVKLIESSKDSIEYAKKNISLAQMRIDSMMLKIDSINKVISAINEDVAKGHTNFQASLKKNMTELNKIKDQVLNEQTEMDKLKQQFKLLK